VEIAALPMQVRGYGHVKMRHYEAMLDKRAALLAAFNSESHFVDRPAQAAE